MNKVIRRTGYSPASFLIATGIILWLGLAATISAYAQRVPNAGVAGAVPPYQPPNNNLNTLGTIPAPSLGESVLQPLPQLPEVPEAVPAAPPEAATPARPANR